MRLNLCVLRNQRWIYCLRVTKDDGLLKALYLVQSLHIVNARNLS